MIYPVYIHNAGVPVAALTPTWSTHKRVSDGANVSQPTISEFGGGWYYFDFDPQYGERYIGVVNAGAGLPNLYRYITTNLFGPDYEKRDKYLHVTSVYAEDGDSLTFVCFLLEDGQLKTTDLTSITLTIYNDLHEVEFTVTTTSFTNGVAVLIKNSPDLVAGESYYVKSELVTSQGTLTSMSVYNVIQ